MRIALDAMGGDYAPEAIVKGAILAEKQLPEQYEILLIGKETIVQQLLQEYGYTGKSIKVVNASQVIEMGEHPTKALTQKPDSSIAVGYGLLKAGKADAFCSAGNTGAMLVGAMFSVKAIEGILRPSIAGLVPKLKGGYGIMLDVGANADCKPEVLEQFAELGSIYAKYVLDIKNPKVGLMNLGEEEGKGTVNTQAAHQRLKVNQTINFIGNIEGRDVFNDKADVIVCDGYTGNIILKMAESIYDILNEKKMHDPFFDKFNYEAEGGSPILGINGNAVIGHGVSTPTAICNMVLQAQKMVATNLSERFRKNYSE
ncbi:phosphate acyltransferase PlsX [Pontibacter sp. BT310]|uniref:Phosphate acyltransferase n=1 Tax=Pontibacter populi TaxID=890055 RepID=A0ABS6XBV1_9BACT|nr:MULTISPECIES: phosphate acyltransferase PlsX [Pontibacter]MBJ6118497.1 phosphate acyltransferase PlsX [Pontibacter sp. BT310]MBR0570926.1 phosphate acyltransferase PlsX [Microvirga sp. STS03]MBW3365351.1 phosphate acyltransferase PlsX [Pontibacter populi]